MSNNGSHNARVWRVTPEQGLRRREWQGEYVLYNDLSGDTHLLGAAAIDLLLALQQTPLAESALGEAGEPGERDAPSLLTQLHALALIEPDA